jgi:hypothetical protein
MKVECPNCTEVNNFPIFRFFNTNKNLVQCEHCKVTLVSNSVELGVITTALGLFSVFLMKYAKSVKIGSPMLSYFLFGLGMIILIFGLYLFFNKLRFKDSGLGFKDPKEIYEVLEKDVKNNNFLAEVNSFKSNYSEYKKSELEKITNESGWQKSAQQAAKELLKEKFNVL